MSQSGDSFTLVCNHGYHAVMTSRLTTVSMAASISGVLICDLNQVWINAASCQGEFISQFGFILFKPKSFPAIQIPLIFMNET